MCVGKDAKEWGKDCIVGQKSRNEVHLMVDFQKRRGLGRPKTIKEIPPRIHLIIRRWHISLGNPCPKASLCGFSEPPPLPALWMLKCLRVSFSAPSLPLPLSEPFLSDLQSCCLSIIHISGLPNLYHQPSCISVLKLWFISNNLS